MMGWSLLALAALQSAAPDWATLPSLPYRAPPLMTPQMHDFAESQARRCGVGAEAQGVTVELAVLVDASGGVRTVAPRAIDCATLEQYALGLVTTFARNNLLPRAASSEQWYKTSLTFRWRR